MNEIQATAGPGNVDISLGYVGTQGASYPINTVFLWTSGPHEAVMNVALRPGAGIDVAALEEKLRGVLPPKFPGCSFSFEPGDIVSQIMNFGAPTPIELAVTGPDFAALRAYTEKLRGELGKCRRFATCRIEQPLNYPSVDVRMNREMAGQLGVTAEQVGRSLSEATASSRFTTPNYWADPKTGVAYQVQVQYPQPRMTSVQDVQNIPVMPGDAAHPLMGDLARVTEGTMVGEYDRINGLWLLSLSANVAGEDLGRVANRIDAAIHQRWRASARRNGAGARAGGSHARNLLESWNRAVAGDCSDLPVPGRQFRIDAAFVCDLHHRAGNSLRGRPDAARDSHHLEY